MSFASGLSAFQAKVVQRQRDVLLRSAIEVQASIQTGSAITGAPGQPVDTGALRGSWSLQFESPTVALVSTNIDYAPYIEDGVGMTLRSTVGGFHSVALTRAGWERVVDHVVAEVVR